MDNQLNAESCVIRSLLADPEQVLPELDFLEPGDFIDTHLGHIFRVARDLWQKKEPLSTESIAITLKIPVSEISSYEWHPPSQAAYFGRIVRKESFGRKVRSGISELASVEGLPPDEQLSRIDDWVSTLHLMNDGGQERSDAASCIEEVSRATSSFGLDKPIMTGIRPIDHIRPIGLRPGHIWIMGGYTGSGKTTVAVQFGANVLEQDGGVVYFSLEMTREEIARQHLAYMGNFSATDIPRGLVPAQSLAPIEARLRGMPLWIHETIFSFPAMLSQVRRHQHQHKVSLVIIDHVQLTRGKGTIYERMERLSGEMKEAAKALSITILGLSQVNNASIREEKARLIEYKGGGDLAAIADVAIMLQASHPNLEILFPKNRSCATGKKTMKFRANYSGIEELPS